MSSHLRCTLKKSFNFVASTFKVSFVTSLIKNDHTENVFLVLQVSIRACWILFFPFWVCSYIFFDNSFFVGSSAALRVAYISIWFKTSSSCLVNTKLLAMAMISKRMNDKNYIWRFFATCDKVFNVHNACVWVLFILFCGGDKCYRLSSYEFYDSLCFTPSQTKSIDVTDGSFYILINVTYDFISLYDDIKHNLHFFNKWISNPELSFEPYKFEARCKSIGLLRCPKKREAYSKPTYHVIHG